MAFVFDFNAILIVAKSGRMLAQGAKDAGLAPLVIDCFGDRDTQLLSLATVKVDSLALDCLSAACSSLNKKYQITHAVYGSGLEAQPKSLAYLQQQYKVLGNTLAVWLAIQHKSHFFSRLQQLHIRHPSVSFQAPKTAAGWLLKPKQNEGGVGIRRYKKEAVSARLYYWQKAVAGLAMSALFIADGQQGFICGLHKQRVLTVGQDEFIFCGISSQPDISAAILHTVRLWVNKLVPAFGLQGINSLDFMLDGDACTLLEVNPRPSASMQLYPENLFAQHLHCCLGGSLEPPAIVPAYRGYNIVFARHRLRVKAAIQWPKWVLDLPLSGAIIHPGLPICSIIAGGANEQQLEHKLSLREQLSNTLLSTG